MGILKIEQNKPDRILDIKFFNRSKVMDQKFKMILAAIVYLILPVFISGCLIESVDQPATVNQGDTFQSTITISDKTADSNPHQGAVDVLVPDDWTLQSGTYTFTGGSGSMIIDTSTIPVYGNVDSAIPPPANMKWLKLLSDKAYPNPANVVYEVVLKLNVGQKTGTFPIGYLTTKNSQDLLVFNPHDYDNDSAWTDTSMNHMVTVNKVLGIEEWNNGIPDKFILSQNYPNPFNPETEINYGLKQSSPVSLNVYSVSGTLVKRLVDEVKNAGYYSVKFSGLDLPSGVYFYKLTTNQFSAVRKMVLLK